jgi:hypothetical protein
VAVPLHVDPAKIALFRGELKILPLGGELYVAWKNEGRMKIPNSLVEIGHGASQERKSARTCSN